MATAEDFPNMANTHAQAEQKDEHGAKLNVELAKEKAAAGTDAPQESRSDRVAEYVKTAWKD